VNTVEDIVDDPHVAMREMLAEVEQPGMDRPVTIAGTPIKLTRTPISVRHRAPLLGEHTDYLLREAGFDDSEISKLREAEVVA
jgi:crotonobetainyl-CoA:carnitine CoA-transferase CaiB-like acyl-CoA transferase